MNEYKSLRLYVGLGVGDEASAQLYKLLLCDEGAMFKPHQEGVPSNPCFRKQISKLFRIQALKKHFQCLVIVLASKEEKEIHRYLYSMYCAARGR
jgi:hypothetical protein